MAKVAQYGSGQTAAPLVPVASVNEYLNGRMPTLQGNFNSMPGTGPQVMDDEDYTRLSLETDNLVGRPKWLTYLHGVLGGAVLVLSWFEFTSRFALTLYFIIFVTVVGLFMRSLRKRSAADHLAYYSAIPLRILSTLGIVQFVSFFGFIAVVLVLSKSWDWGLQ